MGEHKTVVIHRASEPNTTYIVNDANKTYSKHTSEKDDASEASKWTVKKLGKDTVAGRSTEHVQVQREGGGDNLDVWIDKNLVSAGDSGEGLQRRRSRSSPAGGPRSGRRAWPACRSR